MKVPFVDLKAQHQQLESGLVDVFKRVVETNQFILGPDVKRFEEEFARYLDVGHCVAVNNGTTALQLMLLGLGIGPGDEVITVPNTFIATVEAISAVGAQPVFVDVNPISYNMDVSQVEQAITNRTRALLPVHLYGQPTDLDPLLSIARSRGLLLLEDACQGHGAEYKGRKVGTIGKAGCFSFYPSKNLGCCGEGGAVVTDDPALAEHLRLLRDHGSRKKYEHALPGFNFRLEGLQGAILALKLPHLNVWNNRRRVLAEEYNRLLSGMDVATPVEMPYTRHVYHLYVIQVDDREAVREELAKNGIATGLHYPVPIHVQDAYRSLGYHAGDFPVSERLAKRVLSLPMYPELPFESVSYVASILRKLLTSSTVSVGRAEP